MAKLTRKSAKLFAENATAAAGGLAQFGSLAAGTPNYSTDPDVIQALSAYSNGWSDAVLGTKSPALEDRNALDYLLSYQQAYIMQRGVPEWLGTETYYQGSFVSQADGKMYVSKIDNNVNHDPSTDTTETYWMRFPTPQEVAAKVEKAGDTMTGTLVMNQPDFDAINFNLNSSEDPNVSGAYSKDLKGIYSSARIGGVRLTYDNGVNRSQLYTVDGNDSPSFLGIGYDSTNNVVYTTCPASARTNSIVTTTGISKGSSGYVKLGNGMIIQWGSRSGIGTDSTRTITFPTAFSNTNYAFVDCAIINAKTGNSVSSACIRTNSKTTTSVVLIQDTWADSGGQWLAIGY